MELGLNPLVCFRRTVCGSMIWAMIATPVLAGLTRDDCRLEKALPENLHLQMTGQLVASPDSIFCIQREFDRPKEKIRYGIARSLWHDIPDTEWRLDAQRKPFVSVERNRITSALEECRSEKDIIFTLRLTMNAKQTAYRVEVFAKQGGVASVSAMLDRKNGRAPDLGPSQIPGLDCGLSEASAMRMSIWLDSSKLTRAIYNKIIFK
jgi:hypothetical protein